MNIKIIFAVIVIILIAVGIYIVMNWNNPAPTPTQLQNSAIANWKTYTNSEYGFEFRYPNEWSIEEIPIYKNDPGVITILRSPDNTGYAIGPYLPDQDYPDTLTELYSWVNDPSGTRIRKEINFNSYSGYEVTYSPGELWQSKAIYILHNNTLFIIDSEKSDDKYKPNTTHNTILSTFKFTN